MTHVEESRGIIPTTPDVAENDTTGLIALLKYASSGYAKDVKASAQDQAKPIALELVPYWQADLPYSNKVPSWTDDIFHDIDDQGGQYWAFASIIGDLDYAFNLGAADASKLYQEDYPTITKRHTAAHKLRDDYRDHARTCVDYLAGSKPKSSDVKRDCVTKLKDDLSDTNLASLRLTPILFLHHQRSAGSESCGESHYGEWSWNAKSTAQLLWQSPGARERKQL